MILLDTNYLIRLLVPNSAEAGRVKNWYIETDLCTSTVSWYEFLCGPVDDDGIAVVRAVIRDRILPFTHDQAVESARIYNRTGRNRKLRVDAMIAAAAIITNAELATADTEDFFVFKPYGLKIIQGT